METNMYDTKFSEVFKEEIEKEASTYTDKARDDEKKKKSLDTVKVKKWIENSQKHSKKKLNLKKEK